MTKVKAAEKAVAKPLSDPKSWAVVEDVQGVAYLRVSENPPLFILNTGSKVELLEMDKATVQSRNIKAKPYENSEEKVLEAAKILLSPLTSSVIVSERAKKYLEEILNNKEITEMANEKKVAKGKKTATASKSGKAAPKTAAKRTNGIEERFAIVEKVLKGHKGTMSRKEFRAALEGKFANRSTVKAELIAAGKIKEDAEHNISLK